MSSDEKVRVSIWTDDFGITYDSEDKNDSRSGWDIRLLHNNKLDMKGLKQFADTVEEIVEIVGSLEKGKRMQNKYAEVA